MCVCMRECACSHTGVHAHVYIECSILERAEEGIESPGAGVTGDCEMIPNVEVGSQTHVFWKISKYS